MGLALISMEKFVLVYVPLGVQAKFWNKLNL